MKSMQSKLKIGRFICGLLLGISLCTAAANAATNAMNLYDTILNAGAGPSAPTGGAVSVNGSSLSLGDRVVIDAAVINLGPDTGSPSWGTIELNGAGFMGVFGSFSVLVGTAGNQPCDLWVNGTEVAPWSTFNWSSTNRVRIELTATEEGSTTNMDWSVEVDEGITGTYNLTASGTGANFAGNAINLTLAAYNYSHQFSGTTFGVTLLNPATNVVSLGETKNLTAVLSGWPRETAQQWLSNGVPIAGATDLNFTTAAATANNSGAAYSIVVTNLLVPGMVATSGVAKIFLLSAPVTTNTLNFLDTTIATDTGPALPVNAPVTISGAMLAAGDRVVVDGVVINTGGDSGAPGWGTIELNADGYRGVTGAGLSVLVGTATGQAANLWVNGVELVPWPGNGPASINRVRIELTATLAGSTTNMDWVVKVDQGFTGTFNLSQSGTGANFGGNTISVSFGTANYPHQFTSTAFGVMLQNPATNVVALGGTKTLSAVVSGWPRSVAQQWLSNGIPIADATELNFTTAPVTANNSGVGYRIVVTNLLTPDTIITSSVTRVVLLVKPGITNTFRFSPVVLDHYQGPVSPAGGVISFNGAALSAGDHVVFDGLVTALGSGVDAWAGVELNEGGFLGLTGAGLGVLLRTEGSGACEVFINGNGLSAWPSSVSSVTNRVRIELTATTAGSTVNMDWVVKVDQGGTGDFNLTASGAGANFGGNSINLAFGAFGFLHQFEVCAAPLQVSVISGDTLQLTWPEFYRGWTLESQTSAPGIGLTTNWVRIPSSTATNFVEVPIIRSAGSVFYRLVEP